ncbi:MAG: LicD family protein [Clostridiales bacterium]|nr:LicD family protein [Clostridiales bacterium]
MNQEELKKVQLLQLKIAKEIDRICLENNIKYTLAYGSLLGAVRHGGPIPWDDDLDIALVRSEYDRFIEVCKKELGEEYFLQTFETDEYYGWPFAKILLNNTIYKEKWAPEKTKNGVYVDIFPLDSPAKSIVVQHIDNFRFRLYLRALHTKLSYSNFFNSGIKAVILKAIVKVVANFNSADRLKNKINKILIKNNNNNSDLVYNLSSDYIFSKEIMPAEYFNNLIKINFKDEELCVISEYDKYLTQIYGDYLQFPPVDERENRHCIVEMDISKIIYS